MIYESYVYFNIKKISVLREGLPYLFTRLSSDTLVSFLIFSFINTKIPHWFDGLSILLQLTQILVCTVVMMFVFKWFNYKLNLTYTLAALALVGTCFELYINVFKRMVSAAKNRWFTKRQNEVLTP